MLTGLRKIHVTNYPNIADYCIIIRRDQRNLRRYDRGTFCELGNNSKAAIFCEFPSIWFVCQVYLSVCQKQLPLLGESCHTQENMIKCVV